MRHTSTGEVILWNFCKSYETLTKDISKKRYCRKCGFSITPNDQFCRNVEQKYKRKNLKKEALKGFRGKI
jgi:predicted nucleic acid-binding Zn ribbon protein